MCVLLSSDGAWGPVSCDEDPANGDLAAPTVALTYPRDGDVFEPGTSFTIMAEAMDERVIADVELYINDEPQLRDREPPYEFVVQGILAGRCGIGVVACDGVRLTPSDYVYIQVGTPETPQEDSGDVVAASSSTGEVRDAGTETAIDTGTETNTDGNTYPGQSSGGGGGCSTVLAPASAWLSLVLVGLPRRRRR